jgi:hypothetical protein
LPAGWSHVPLPSHSSSVQVSPSSVHGVPGDSLFAWQALLPSQVSEFVQSVSLGSPHGVPDVSKPSAGQSSFTPSQFSATSHSPVSARHSDVLFASAGHVALDPVQVSAGSHSPAETRHVWPEARKTQPDVQHDVLAPLSPPRSHSSLPLTIPSPQSTGVELAVGVDVKVAVIVAVAVGTWVWVGVLVGAWVWVGVLVGV